MTPEDKARLKIDALLEAAGWVIQDKDALNLGAGLGVIVRHFQLGKDEADYVMFIDRKACLLYTSPSPRDATLSRMPSSA